MQLDKQQFTDYLEDINYHQLVRMLDMLTEDSFKDLIDVIHSELEYKKKYGKQRKTWKEQEIC